MNIKFDLYLIVFFITVIIGLALIIYGALFIKPDDDKDINKIKETSDRKFKYLIIGASISSIGFILIITSLFYPDPEKKIKSLLTKNPKPSVNSSVNSSENSSVNSSILSDSILSSDYYNSETSFINPVYVPR